MWPIRRIEIDLPEDRVLAWASLLIVHGQMRSLAQKFGL